MVLGAGRPRRQSYAGDRYSDGAKQHCECRWLLSGNRVRPVRSVYTGIIQAWVAQGLKTLGLRIGYEMNSQHYMPWSLTSASEVQSRVAAFRHLATLSRQVASAAGVNAQIIWNPVSINATAVNSASLYPGNTYVDVISTDMYCPAQPLGLYNWAANNGTYASPTTQWAFNPLNLLHWWEYPNATAGNPNGNWDFSSSPAAKPATAATWRQDFGGGSGPGVPSLVLPVAGGCTQRVVVGSGSLDAIPTVTDRNGNSLAMSAVTSGAGTCIQQPGRSRRQRASGFWRYGHGVAVYRYLESGDIRRDRRHHGRFVRNLRLRRG